MDDFWTKKKTRLSGLSLFYLLKFVKLIGCSFGTYCFFSLNLCLLFSELSAYSIGVLNMFYGFISCLLVHSSQGFVLFLEVLGQSSQILGRRYRFLGQILLIPFCLALNLYIELLLYLY